MRKKNQSPGKEGKETEVPGSIGLHPRKFRDLLSCVKQAAEQAREFVGAAVIGGRPLFAEAATTFLEQQVMQSLFEVVKPQQQGEPFDAAHWQSVIKTVSEVAKVRTVIDKLAREANEAAGEKRKTDGPGLVARMREALGLPPAAPPRPLPMPPEPKDDAPGDDQTRFSTSRIADLDAPALTPPAAT